jgi:AAA domain
MENGNPKTIDLVESNRIESNHELFWTLSTSSSTHHVEVTGSNTFGSKGIQHSRTPRLLYRTQRRNTLRGKNNDNPLALIKHNNNNKKMKMTKKEVENDGSASSINPETTEDGWSTVGNQKKKKRSQRTHQQHPPATPTMPTSSSSSSWSSSSPPLSVIEPIPPTVENTHFRPFLLLLMGLPGSGKSTLATTLEQAMPYKFVRINQDQLGSRKKCQAKLRSVLWGEDKDKDKDDDAPLTIQRCPIIDRCNFDSQQRSTWYTMAEEFRQKQQQQQQQLLPPSWT